MVAGAGRSPVPGAGVQPPLGLGPQRLETPSRRRRGLVGLGLDVIFACGPGCV